MSVPSAFKQASLLFAAFVATGTSASAETIPLFLQYPKLDQSRWYIAHGWSNGRIQSCEWRKEALSVRDGNLLITLSDRGGKVSPISCGEIQSKQTYNFGSFSVRMRAASGSGLNSAFFTYSGPPVGKIHDEIDFEFLGKSPTKVQLNYYIEGKPQDGTIIDLGFDATKEFHDYTFVWQPDSIRWFVDDKLVHETKAGAKIPSHPGKIYLTLWSGSEKVNDWLGPFKYTEDKDAEFSWVKYTPVE